MHSAGAKGINAQSKSNYCQHRFCNVYVDDTHIIFVKSPAATYAQCDVQLLRLVVSGGVNVTQL